MKSDVIYMHEYGHTFDSRRFGFSYLLAVGLPSIISAAGDGNHNRFWTEIRANRWAKKYFETHYGVDWNSSYWDRVNKRYITIESRYPTY